MSTVTGYYRKRQGKGFSYKTERGTIIVSTAIRSWIDSLAIPPAWRDVWISKDKEAYLLATGYDDKNRKQYIYHPNAADIREARKLERLIALGTALPKVKDRIKRDLKDSKLSKDRVLAAVLEIILATGMRIGNEQYQAANDTYGATTLRKKHVSGKKRKVFDFVGKSHVEQNIVIDDPTVVAVITECEDTPGLELFKFIDEDGVRHDVTSDDVNDYIHRISGVQITAKDFRTWYGSVAALETCIKLGKCEEACEQAHMKTIFKHAAEVLGNTPKIAAESYVHESVIEAHRSQRLRNSSASSGKLTKTEALLFSILKAYEATK